MNTSPRWFGNLLKILVSLGLIVYLLKTQVDIRLVLDLFSQARLEFFVGAGALMVVGTALRAVRWGALLRPLGMHVPLRTLVRLYFIGAFFNLFLPTGMGGDAVKMVKLAQETQRGPEAIGTTLVDRASGLWVLFGLATIALPFSYHLLPPSWLAPILAISLLGLIGGFVFVATPLLPRIGGLFHLPGQAKLERFYRSVSRLGFRALGEACLVSLVFDLLLILFNIWIAEGFSVQQPLGIFFLFTPIISFSLALPISIGGLGVREQTYVVLFHTVGVQNSAAVAMSLLNYFLTNIVVGLLGGILYALEGASEIFRSSRK